MRAVQAKAFGGPEVLHVVDAEAPVPGPDEVQIEVRLAGVNFADVNARRGAYAQPGAAPPQGFGLEVYGVVSALGERVDRFAVGQAVAGFSSTPGYAEVAVSHADLVWAVPDRVVPEQAAGFPVVGSTAFHLLASAARLQPGESVLVTAAAGGVGSVAVQIARLRGAGLVVAAAGSAERAAEAMGRGADAVLDYSTDSLPERLRAAGVPVVDVVLDGVGGAVRRAALDCLGTFGRLVQFGNASGSTEELPTLRELRERNIGVIGFHLQRLRTERRDLLGASAQTLLQWLEDGSLDLAVSEVLPLDRAAEAHRMLESRQVSGKLLLALDGCGGAL